MFIGARQDFEISVILHRVNLFFFGFENTAETNCQLYFANDFFALQLVAKVAKATTETELTGIRIAATTGERCPDKA